MFMGRSCSWNSSRCRGSVTDGKAALDILALLQFVDHRYRVIVEGNLAVALGILDYLILAQPELASSCTGFDHHGRGEERPVDIVHVAEQFQRADALHIERF